MTDVDSKQCVWVELAALKGNGQMVRNEFVRFDDTAAIAKWRKTHRNCDVFQTVCRFLEPDCRSPCICDCFLDIDADDLRVALRESRDGCHLLSKHLGIDVDYVDIAFSGAKGFHLRAASTMFGNPVGVHVMLVWKHLAKRLFKSGIKHVDLGVYQPARLLRLANSINSKTGLYKVPFEYRELADLGLEYVMEMAREPRDEDSMILPPAENERAVAWFAEAKTWVETRQSRLKQPPRQKGWRTTPCIRRLEASVLPDGFRHDAYYTLARFYASTGMAKQEAIERLSEMDRRNPIRDPNYLRRVVDNAWQRPGFYGCPNPTLEPYCDFSTCFLAHGNCPVDKGAQARTQG